MKPNDSSNNAAGSATSNNGSGSGPSLTNGLFSIFYQIHALQADQRVKVMATQPTFLFNKRALEIRATMMINRYWTAKTEVSQIRAKCSSEA